MKIKLTLFFLFSLIFSAQTYAQTKPVALKFDEFDDSSNDQLFEFNEINLSQRIERLVKQVKKQRGVKVYIIYYRARQLNDGEVNKAEYWAGRTEYTVTLKANFKYEDVVSIDGGYRERNTLEYWIALKNVEPPKPSPTFDKSESVVCKEVRVFGNTDKFDKGKTISFSAATSYDSKLGEAFQWKVSAGELIAGQGTNEISIDLKNVGDRHITASAETEDLPLSCPKLGYAIVDLNQKLFPFDSAVRYNYSDLRARLDAFLVELMNNPTAKGYIVVYANRSRETKEMERAIKDVKNHFVFRRYDLSRITIVRGGYRDYNTVDSWILRPGDETPKPTPTVDSKFINIPKQPKKAVRHK